MFKLNDKYFTLLNLYLAQSIPMSFFSTVLPVIMRMEQHSLTSIGLIQLIKLPWILKFLWAPIIDKTSDNLNKYKRWIILSEIFYAFVILCISFFSLQTNFTTIIVLMLIAFTASATQDIATDAFAILILKKEERSLGNSMQSAGSFLGTLTGSGFLLVIYHYWGWNYLLIALAGFVLLALVPLYLYKTKNRQIIETKSEIAPIRFSDIFLFFSQKKQGKHIFFLFIYYTGIIGVLTMLKPWLVDLGYDVKEIGFMSGIYGAGVGALFAFLAGLVIKRIGKKSSLILFSALALVTVSYFYILTLISADLFFIMVGISFLWGSYGILSVLIYTISMEKVREGREGTDFTIQIVLTHLSSLIIAVLSGKFAHAFSYKTLFLTEIIVSLLVLMYIIFVYTKTEKKEILN